MVAIGKYPEQTAHQRKEQLYRDAIDLFDRGSNWEGGIPLCKQLARLYETDLFDYEKLSAMLVRERERERVCLCVCVCVCCEVIVPY